MSNRFSILNKEAKGEWRDGVNIPSMYPMYACFHAIERAGVGLTKYALSDTKKDLENPWKFMAKKMFLLSAGATIASAGAVYKTIANPLYPLQGIRHMYQKFTKTFTQETNDRAESKSKQSQQHLDKSRFLNLRGIETTTQKETSSPKVQNQNQTQSLQILRAIKEKGARI